MVDRVALGRNPMPILIPPNTSFLASVTSCWYIGPCRVHFSSHATNWEWRAPNPMEQCCMFFLEMMIVTKPLKTSRLHRTRKLIIVLVKARHWTVFRTLWSRPPPSYRINIHFTFLCVSIYLLFNARSNSSYLSYSPWHCLVRSKNYEALQYVISSHISPPTF